MWFPVLLLAATASLISAGEVTVYGGANCPAGCDSTKKLIVAADRSTGCIPFLGQNTQVSAQSITNISPACIVEFYADAKCTVPEFVIDTTKRAACKSFPGRGAMRWTCSGSPINQRRRDLSSRVSNPDSGMNDRINGSALLPFPSVGDDTIADITAAERLAKRQCNHEGLYNNMLFYGPPVRVPDSGATEGGNDLIIRDVSTAGGGGFPGGTLNADARDVTREVYRISIPSRVSDLEFQITTASGLRFEVTLSADSTVSGAITAIGVPALAAILAAAFVAMSETGNQLIFFRILDRELGGGAESLVHVSIELLDSGNE